MVDKESRRGLSTRLPRDLLQGPATKGTGRHPLDARGEPPKPSHLFSLEAVSAPVSSARAPLASTSCARASTPKYSVGSGRQQLRGRLDREIGRAHVLTPIT